MHTYYNYSDSQLRITVTKGAETLGYLVIDSIMNGHSYGGVRLMPKIDEKEIAILARAMTLKFGFLGLPHGGAKAGVIGDPEAPPEERLARLKVFGQAISPLLANRVYIPATDMGTYNADILYMVKSAGMHVKKREFTVERSGYYTALTVFAGIKQAARHVGIDMPDCRIAIEGFGKVGSALATILHNAKARIAAISTSRGAIYNPEGLDVIRLTRLASEAGSRAVDIYENAEHIGLPSLFELPVDILCPCALTNTINTENAERISARIISPGANNPVSPEAEPVLHRRGIISLPYFMTNCGGTLGGTMEFASVKKNKIEEFIDIHIGGRITKLLEDAAGKG
ncbi:MAG: Glu/Leu/Phe/Val dehydrogenase, partial [Deltaproteobacteria bacterium]|nr:Glu/Leu/Phe/Val dehydrogenase [Deltaproteobacteria bacterium]